jgi:hypothetical protein
MMINMGNFIDKLVNFCSCPTYTTVYGRLKHKHWPASIKEKDGGQRSWRRKQDEGAKSFRSKRTGTAGVSGRGCQDGWNGTAGVTGTGRQDGWNGAAGVAGTGRQDERTGTAGVAGPECQDERIVTAEGGIWL